MKKIQKFMLFMFCFISPLQSKAEVKKQKNVKVQSRVQADWTILTYIQADNNLAYFADYNINHMQRVGSTDKVNVLVQWDQPHNNKTWRYKIEKGSKVDAGSLNQEMGVQPVREIIDAMAWAKSKFPARRYALILWNHGNGVLRRNGFNKVSPFAWLRVPGLDVNKLTKQERGILYDDSQFSFVDNDGLLQALSGVKSILGKKLNIIGMDACLMAMTEIAYQVRQCAYYMVGSQDLEPGEGWPYEPILKSLVENSKQNSRSLASTIVKSYKKFYQHESDCTQSAIRLSRVYLIRRALDRVITRIQSCAKVNASLTKQLVRNARSKALEFAIDDYIDLYHFLDKLHLQASNMRSRYRRSKVRFSSRLLNLMRYAKRAQTALLSCVVQNGVGSTFRRAKGLSVYYPTGSIERHYKTMQFCRNSKWLDFISNY
jgi:hypothetical protein